MFQDINLVEIFSTFLVMFAIIDITGSIPIFVSMRDQGKAIKPLQATSVALLLFVARPLAVWLCLTGSSFTFKERVFVSWVGLRGAAPIMLATFPLAAGIPYAQEIFNLVFFIVLTSIVVQGGTLMPLARYLGLACRAGDRDRAPLELEITESGGDSEMFEFEVPPGADFAGGTVAELGLPSGALILLMRRDGHYFAPRGNTRIESGDGMLIMGPGKVMRDLSERFFPDADYRPVRSWSEIVHDLPRNPREARKAVTRMLTGRSKDRKEQL